MGLSAKRPSKTATATKPNKVTMADLVQEKAVVRVNINLTEQQRNKLKRYALDNNKTMTEVLIAYIDRLDER